MTESKTSEPTSEPAVSSMAAGRELNREIALRVMGWRNPPPPAHGGTWHPAYLTPPNEPDDVTQHVPPYSTSIEAAWHVVEKLKERGLTVCMELRPGALAVAWIVNVMTREPEHYAPAPARAICLAALAFQEAHHG